MVYRSPSYINNSNAKFPVKSQITIDRSSINYLVTSNTQSPKRTYIIDKRYLDDYTAITGWQWYSLHFAPRQSINHLRFRILPSRSRAGGSSFSFNNSVCGVTSVAFSLIELQSRPAEIIGSSGPREIRKVIL